MLKFHEMDESRILRQNKGEYRNTSNQKVWQEVVVIFKPCFSSLDAIRATNMTALGLISQAENPQ